MRELKKTWFGLIGSYLNIIETVLLLYLPQTNIAKKSFAYKKKRLDMFFFYIHE